MCALLTSRQASASASVINAGRSAMTTATIKIGYDERQGSRGSDFIAPSLFRGHNADRAAAKTDAGTNSASAPAAAEGGGRVRRRRRC